MQPLRIFIGYDERQPIAFTALSQSILSLSSKPVSITPLVLSQLPINRAGLTPFTFSRFLVPWLCNYEGWGLFLDIDIILNDDISKLFALVDDRHSVFVSKNEKRFEWASVMMFNNAECKILTPDYVQTANGLHTIDWCPEDKIGELPPEWNHLVGYDNDRPDAKLIHYTQGVPAFFETDSCEHSQLWRDAVKVSQYSTSWSDLMAQSVHSAHIKNPKNNESIPFPLYYVDKDKQCIREEFKSKLDAIVEGKNERA